MSDFMNETSEKKEESVTDPNIETNNICSLCKYFQRMADSQEDKVEIIDYDSDKNDDDYEDASESLNDGPHDMTRPSEWRPKPSENKDNVSDEAPEEDVVKDSLGHEEGSPDYVDEELLKTWEDADHENVLSDPQLEQKRLEAAQYKLEGNSLYTDGKTLEACGKN